ncbi:hypothetical protein MPNB_5840 [Mycoplasmoides pneumoniae]|nr:hypothetical protein MPNB_5840 [Mycoplasmoides pneumoniae]
MNYDLSQKFKVYLEF